MRSIKMLGLAALAALMAMAFVGVSSAMGEPTMLCKADETKCKSPVTHVHETSVTDALLLNSLGNVKCAVLFLGDVPGAYEETYQIVEGNFTYSSCFRKKLFGGEESCTVKELSGPAEIQVLREGHETAKVTGEGEVELTCGTSINCVYNGEGLAGTAKGPLLSTQKNGEVTITNAVTHKVKGSLCPEEGKLDINTTPLEATYLKAPPFEYCVKYEHVESGFYLNHNNGECVEADATRKGMYMKVYTSREFELEEMICVRMRQNKGLYKNYNVNSNLKQCENDIPAEEPKNGRYELGTVL